MFSIAALTRPGARSTGRLANAAPSIQVPRPIRSSSATAAVRRMRDPEEERREAEAALELLNSSVAAQGAGDLKHAEKLLGDIT